MEKDPRGGWLKLGMRIKLLIGATDGFQGEEYWNWLNLSWNNSYILAFIPKGVLERSKKVCFNFLWGGRHDNPGLHLAKWLDIAKPKDMGGWGLQHIHLFGESLGIKILWNLLTKDSF